MSDFTDPSIIFCGSKCPSGPDSHCSQGCRGTSGRSGEGSGGRHRCRGVELTSFPMLIFIIYGDFYKGRNFATSMHINSCTPWPFLAHFNGITRYYQDKSHV